MIKRPKYVAGRWIADNTFFNFDRVLQGLVEVDMIGMGCALIHRKVLEKITFESGTNLACKDELGNKAIVGECGAFGNAAFKAGYKLYMDGNIVCKHLPR
jgi:hypothetical protein